MNIIIMICFLVSLCYLLLSLTNQVLILLSFLVRSANDHLHYSQYISSEMYATKDYLSFVSLQTVEHLSVGQLTLFKSLVLLQAIRETVALVCEKDQLMMEFANGDLRCVKCPRCPPGLGSTVSCGSTVIAPYNDSFMCKPCMQGEYSDVFSSESCKTCSKCLPDEGIVAKCTNISDTRCSCKPCPKGYYRNNTLSKCLPCSECCLDGVDEVVPQCVSQAISRSQTCRYQKRKPCGSKCWFDKITVLRRDGKHSCRSCPACSKESGLTVPCGSVVREETFIGCERPTLGKTFVNQQGILQSCNICSPGQDVTQNCSLNADTKCGECKKGFYYNYYSKTCQECFSCCNHMYTDNIMECIRKRMPFSELNNGFLTGQIALFLQLQGQSFQACHEYYLLRLLSLNNWVKLALGLILASITYFVLNFISQRRSDARNKAQNFEDHTLDRKTVSLLQKPQYNTTFVEASQDASSGEQEEFNNIMHLLLLR